MNHSRANWLDNIEDWSLFDASYRMGREHVRRDGGDGKRGEQAGVCRPAASVSNFGRLSLARCCLLAVPHSSSFCALDPAGD